MSGLHFQGSESSSPGKPLILVNTNKTRLTEKMLASISRSSGCGHVAKDHHWVWLSGNVRGQCYLCMFRGAAAKQQFKWDIEYVAAICNFYGLNFSQVLCICFVVVVSLENIHTHVKSDRYICNFLLLLPLIRCFLCISWILKDIQCGSRRGRRRL